MTYRPLRSVPPTVALFGLLLVLVVACGESNPLLGRWVLDEDASDGLAAAGAAISMSFSGVAEIEFLEDQMVMGGKSEAVSYEIGEGRVIVTGPDGEGLVYTVVDPDHIVLGKSTGKLAFKRVKPAAEGAAQPPSE